MTDRSTMRDHIEDLMTEVAELRRIVYLRDATIAGLREQVNSLSKQLDQAMSRGDR